MLRCYWPRLSAALDRECRIHRRRRSTLIIDTGANAAAAATIHGYASIARPSNRLLVLDTERHFDHIGGNDYFRERGVDVYGHASIHRTEEEFRAEMSEFNGEISNPARRSRHESEVFYHGTRLANPNCPITEDSRMDLGACEIDILLTPGHTPSNISVYVPSDGVLFCGDCLVNGYLPNLDAGVRRRLVHLAKVSGSRGGACAADRRARPWTGGDWRRSFRLIESVREVLQQSIEAGRSPTS